MAATSTSKRKKRRRNKTRKTKVRDPDVTINANDLGSDEIEEIVDFDEVMVPLEMNVGTGGVSGSQQHVDIPEVSGLWPSSLHFVLNAHCGVRQLHFPPL